MNLSRLLSLAKNRYEEDGGRVLAKNTLQFGYRKGTTPIAEKVIKSKYNQMTINYPEMMSCISDESIWRLEDDVSHLYPEKLEDITPLKHDISLEFSNYPAFVPNEPFVAEIENVTVVGPDAVALNNDGKVIAETINSTNDSYNGRVGRAISSAIIDSPYRVGTALLGNSTPSPVASLPIASILHSRWNNYYHWTLEHLLKLRGISYYERVTGNDVTLIIPPNPPSFITESLRLLGYTDNYIEWDGEPLQVNQLVVPTFPELTPKTIEWLRRSMLNSVNISDSNPEWVYISRQNENKRRIENYKEVKAVLDNHGIETVFCENLSMEEEVRLFSSVKGIIGAHGAGLTAMVWGTDISVIEIFNGVVKRPYYVLADVLGHNYDALSGQPVGNANQRRNLNIIVDVEELEEKLEEMVR